MNPNQVSEDEDEDDHSNSNNSPSFSSYTANTHLADIASRVAADDDFEFHSPANTFPASMPVYPVFNRDLLRDLGSQETSIQQLRKLFLEDDLNNDEFDCLWAPEPPSVSVSGSMCMKSSSTGSGSGAAPVMPKTWRLRNLLRRCKSDGKEGLMLVTTGDASKKTGKEPARRRKSYLPYKPDLLGFFGTPQTLRTINIPPF